MEEVNNHHVSRPTRVVRKPKNSIPEELLNNAKLNEAISVLPSNYNFEIHKSVWKVLQEKPEITALQFPEGLLMYACIIGDIISRFGNTRIIIFGDVTYGACCIDDFSAHKLGASLIIHYGHSCLIPTSVTKVKVLYVFVEIKFEHHHLVEIIKKNFPADSELYLLGTVQFIGMVHAAGADLRETMSNIKIPQEKPLSAGETLGCTSPILSRTGSLVFVADGRFHLEAAMIQNPTLAAYRYDPYSRVLTAEGYDTETMKAVRWQAIETARSCRVFGVILGTLGRQGNQKQFDRIISLLRSNAALDNKANCPLQLDRRNVSLTDGINNSSCYKVALQKVADASHNDVHVYPEWFDAIYVFMRAIESKTAFQGLS